MSVIDHLAVSEIFGPTLQGEGREVGRSCIFLRLHHCPVHCPGCDTAFTWDGRERGTMTTYDAICKRFTDLLTDQHHLGLVVSGGEPLLHFKNPDLIWLLKQHGWAWKGLETSGYAGPQPIDRTLFDRFLEPFTSISLSPKITPCLHGRQTDDELEVNIKNFIAREVYKLGARKTYFKFVVKDDADIEAVLRCDQRHGFRSHYETYLMPYGNDRDEILKSVEKLIPAAKKYGFIITPRLHSLIWGSARGH